MNDDHGIAQYQPQKPSRPVRYQLNIADVGGGNTLDSGQTGIAVSATKITEVPTAYDPSTSPTCIDGVGYGTMIIDNSVLEDSYDILIVLDTRSPITVDLLNTDRIAVHPDPVEISVTGGGTVLAYVPLWY